MLEKMNEKFVASVTSAICMSTKALDRTLDIFTEYYVEFFVPENTVTSEYNIDLQ